MCLYVAESLPDKAAEQRCHSWGEKLKLWCICEQIGGTWFSFPAVINPKQQFQSCGNYTEGERKERMAAASNEHREEQIKPKIG